MHSYQPAEVLASLRQEAEQFLTPQEHEEAAARRLVQVIGDPVIADLGAESVTGDSQLRPGPVFPI